MEARLQAISEAHGLMRLQPDRTDVSLHSLIGELVSRMRSTAGLAEDDIRLSFHGSDRRLGSGEATSLGMILNELMTNALKYGLDAQAQAEIEVSVETEPDGTTIVVRNRIEPRQPIPGITSSKVGSILIRQLVAEIKGEIQTGVEGAFYIARLRLPQEPPAGPSARSANADEEYGPTPAPAPRS